MYLCDASWARHRVLFVPSPSCPSWIHANSLSWFLLILKVQTLIFLVEWNNIKLFKWLPLSLNESAGRRDMFLIIYLTSEQRSELNGPACCLFLLGSLRLHCFCRDIIFCPGWCLHRTRLIATVHANQKLWFMHLSLREWNIKFNFAAVELCLRRAPAWHGEPGLPPPPPPRRNSLLPPQYAKATFEWNICLMSEQSSVYSLYTDT